MPMSRSPFLHRYSHGAQSVACCLMKSSLSRQRAAEMGWTRWNITHTSCHPDPTSTAPSAASMMPMGMPVAR